MALFDHRMINDVTRVELSTGFLYHFPLEIIETNTHGNYMVVRPRGQSRSEQIDFADIDVTDGANDIQSYVENLALSGKYQTSNELKSAIDQNEYTNRMLLNSISSVLYDIRFLLQKLNE